METRIGKSKCHMENVNLHLSIKNKNNLNIKLLRKDKTDKIIQEIYCLKKNCSRISTRIFN